MGVGDSGPRVAGDRDIPLHGADVAELGTLGGHGGGPGQGREHSHHVRGNHAEAVRPRDSPVVSLFNFNRNIDFNQFEWKYCKQFFKCQGLKP